MLQVKLFSLIFFRDIDTETVVNSLLVEIIDKNTSPSNRFFAYAILQKLQNVALSSEIISADLGQQLIYTLPILFTQVISINTFPIKTYFF